MQKAGKRWFTILAALCLAAAGFVIGNIPTMEAKALPRAAEAKTMDMYLIAGQSNAAGYSVVNGTLTEEYDSIAYAGQIDCPINGTVGMNDYLDTFSPKVVPSLGRPGRIGPEYGMARSLSSLYSAGRQAMIFKTAAGGTSLSNATDHSNLNYGNWYPPSVRTTASQNVATGKLYDRFVANFAKVHAKLVTDGYRPRVVGMVWMQGENDRYTTNYDDLVAALVSDLRSDLSDITGDDLSQMPFVMGEISDTYNKYGDMELNQKFNRQLHEIANSLDNVHVISSHGYAINSPTGAVGSDEWHWNAADMSEIGSLFATKLLNAAQAKTIPAGATGTGELIFPIGAVQYTVSNGSIQLKPTMPENCVLKAFSVNGTPATLTDGVYEMPFTQSVTVNAVFGQPQLYRVSYKPDNTLKGRFVYGEYCKPEYPFGTTVTVKVVPAAGYEVESVTFNGTDMTYDAENDVYTAGPIDRNSQVVANYREKTEPTPTPTPSREKPKKGCGGAVASVLSILSAIGIGVLFLKRV